ncbi:MAG: hypothetical protein HKN16_10570 [Saprospiraceae bacterium]|nr:hypothetical protein [Saprospiraceae bacterium]
MLYWLFQILKSIFLLVLPFIILIRGAVYFHSEYHLHPWAALLGGAGAAMLVLFIYLTFVHGRFTGKIGSKKTFKRRGLIVLVLVLGYCVHGLFFLSSKNTKAEEVRTEFTNLHPILRLGVSTIVFLDRDLIITDASRFPEDYKKMGLPRKGRSLHYKQSNGFAHALDLRTNGRSEFRNTLLKGYFWAMGFNTLRHVGTGDHLHISLQSHDTPGAI